MPITTATNAARPAAPKPSGRPVLVVLRFRINLQLHAWIGPHFLVKRARWRIAQPQGQRFASAVTANRGRHGIVVAQISLSKELPSAVNRPTILKSCFCTLKVSPILSRSRGRQSSCRRWPHTARREVAALDNLDVVAHLESFRRDAAEVMLAGWFAPARRTVSTTTRTRQRLAIAAARHSGSSMITLASPIASTSQLRHGAALRNDAFIGDPVERRAIRKPSPSTAK